MRAEQMNHSRADRAPALRLVRIWFRVPAPRPLIDARLPRQLVEQDRGRRRQTAERYR